MANQPIILSLLVLVITVTNNGVNCQGLRLKMLLAQVCMQESMNESKLQAMEWCRFRSITNDYTPIRDCGKKVFGNYKTLDDLRKEACQATQAQRNQRMQSMNDCLMTYDAIRANVNAMTMAMQSMSQEEQTRARNAQNEAIVLCMEQAYMA